MTDQTAVTPDRSLLALVRRVIDIEPNELKAVLWSFAYFFSVLCSYYIIRPLRDEMGVTVGTERLSELFGIVFVVMLAAVPLFGWVVSTFARRRIAPIVYGFFILNLIVFWSLLSAHGASKAVASAFFVWVSVFNLFVVSLFWSVMSDLWSSAQAKRLYGFIAAGGSLGAFLGPLITQSLVHGLGATNLLLVSAAVLGLAIFCIRGLRSVTGADRDAETERPAGEGLIDGAKRVFQSPYLLQIAIWVLLANLISTVFYFEQSRIIGNSIAVREDRVALFARMDLAVSVLTILGQVFLTGNIVRRLGLGMSIAALPVSAALGLAALAAAPVLWVIVAVIVFERAVTFAITNPAARVLYTVVPAEDKYKAQNFIDTVVYRGGDAASGWIFNGLAKSLGLATPAVALITLPFTLFWIASSFRLGREQAARAEAVPKP